jgi:hypothetical protein
MTRVDDDEPTAEEVAEAARRLPRDVLPYASKTRGTKPPIDWARSIRQVIFALGLGLASGVLMCATDSYRVLQDGLMIWIGIATFMVALTLPWPGRIGRRRR